MKSGDVLRIYERRIAEDQHCCDRMKRGACMLAGMRSLPTPACAPPAGPIGPSPRERHAYPGRVRTQLADDTVAVLRRLKGATAAELGAVLGIKPNTALMRLSTLVKKQLAVKGRDGKYRSTAAISATTTATVGDEDTTDANDSEE